MKRSFKIVIPILFVIAASQVFAADVVVTPNQVNALQQAVAAADSGDTMLLEYGALFPNQGSVTIDSGIVLTIKATGDASLAKPYIKEVPNDAGDYGSQTLEVKANLLLINIKFDGARGTGTNNSRAIRVQEPGIRLKIDSCAFANYTKRTVALNKAVTSIVITNTIFAADRKMDRLDEGRGVDARNGDHGLIKIQNNTFINCTDRWFRHQKWGDVIAPVIDTIIVDHNTFIHNMGYRPPFQFTSVKVLQFTNNIVVNPVMIGTDTLTNRLDEVAYLDSAAVTILGPQAIVVFSVTEVDSFNTEVTMANNNVYLEQAVEDKYAASTRVSKAPLYNAELEALIDPDTTTFEEVLTFVNVPDTPLSMVDVFINQVDTLTIPANLGAALDVNPNTMQYIPYNLLDANYGTAAVSYTAAAGGFPLGDLNWYPGQKAAWEAGDPPLGISAPAGAVPEKFSLTQNFPNPFNPTTTIAYQLNMAADVKLVIYSVLGRDIRTLVNKKSLAGEYSIQWNGRNNAGNLVASGIYFYRLEAGDQVQVRKMLLLK